MEIFEPATLQDAIVYFSSPGNCREYLVAHRWPDGVTCPRCGSKNVLFQAKYNRWQCGSKHDVRQFTSKTGTIFKPAPNVPGDTPSERLSNALSMVLRVSKADLMKKEARLRRASEKRRTKKKRAS